MNQTNTGCLVISLDFELIWGIFDKIDPLQKKKYFLKTRDVIPQILNLFEKYEIHCTWAIVGMLFNKNFEEWNSNIPSAIPDYKNPKLSPYLFAKQRNDKGMSELYFAKEIIEGIKKLANQEIGTHTYSHYYCLEEGQSIETFKVDLEKAINMAGKMDIKLKTLIFPRNQINDSYLKVCYQLGIENVRSNPDNWYWRNTFKNDLRYKIFRTGDAYLGLNNKSYILGDMPFTNNVPIAQKASRLLRPHSPNKLLNSLKLRRIKSEMTYAAKKGEVYHLWWHPHNFGNNPKENLQDLEIILNHYKKCRLKYDFKSFNMEEIGNLLKYGM